MKLLLLSLLPLLSTAFLPPTLPATSTTLSAAASKASFDPTVQIGALPPVGFWDPAKLASGITEKKFNFYREAEIKHGRVCQLTVLGFVTPEFFRWPGEINGFGAFADVPNGVAAQWALPIGCWWGGIIMVGAAEIGLLSFGDTEQKGKTEAELARATTQEIQHG